MKKAPQRVPEFIDIAGAVQAAEEMNLTASPKV